MRKLFIPSSIFIISFLYYGYQVCPTFYFWDSAELTAAVMGHGVPHPPGFPSLLIIAKIWNWILPLNKAHGLNVLSSFFASLGLAFWYFVVRQYMQSLFREKSDIELALLSLTSVITLGVSFSYSVQAVRFEVYSLSFACFSLLLYLATRITAVTANKRLIYAFLMIIIAVLSLGAHHFTIALTFPGIILLVSYKDKIKLKHYIFFFAAIIIILVPLYVYVYYLASGDPLLNWGNPSNLGNFIDYFFLREFSTPLSSLAPAHLIDNLSFGVGLLVKQIGILGSLLAIWGIVKLVRLTPKMAVPMTLILILNLFSILYYEDYFYENYDLHGYLLFSIAAVSLFMALIIGFLSERTIDLIKSKFPGRQKEGQILIAIIIAAVIMYMPLKTNLYSADLSEMTAAEEYANLFLNDSPSNSIIISSYYNSYFCLLAYQELNPSDDGRLITNVYNWEHEWGRNQTAERLGFAHSKASSRWEFYRAVLNEFKDGRPIYVEYDNASAPIIKYLKPSGLGYMFSISDTVSIDSDIQFTEIDRIADIALKYRDIEAIRTWVLWFQNRGEYFLKRGSIDLANRYFKASEQIASSGKTGRFK